MGRMSRSSPVQVRDLAHPDEQRRAGARERLIAAGADAVPPLVAELLDEGSPVDWAVAGSILRTIGRPAFPALAEAIAAAPTAESRRRCGWAFVGFGADLVDDYAAALSHPSGHVRQDAALGIQYLREAGLPAVPALARLLSDPDEEVRQRAVWAFGGIGEAAVPALQQIRVAGPGRLRPGALQALAEVVGERGLTSKDRAVVERLIQVKLRTERPAALDDCAVCGPWLALPTGDQRAVLAALDLSNPQPATMRLGFAAFYCDRHGAASEEQTEGRVFVTPRLDGWTLVLGAWYTRWGGYDSYGEACRDVSSRFGTAQAYWYDAQTGASAWVVCADGEILRWYDPDREPAEVGARLPVEQGLLLPDEDTGIPDEVFAAWSPSAPDASERLVDLYARYHVPATCDALTVAAAMSVSPRSLGPDTDVHGHGLLALTSVGRAHGVPTGALPI